MKTFLLCLFAILSSLGFPTIGYADYAIHLRHGGRFSTAQYWETNNEIRFFNSGGTVGIEKNFVLKIEKLPDDPDRDAYITALERPLPQAKPAPTVTEEKVSSTTPEPEEKLDIQAYKNRKDRMKGELDDFADKLREATLQKDEAAKQRYLEEMRKVSQQIYGLTDEVTKKNKGKLPDGWWD